MADVFSKVKRSWVMSRITSKNTKPELEVFRFLRRNGIYFQKHYRRLVGRPDIAFPKRKIAINIDGDFWHGRQFGLWRKRMPSIYWVKKIENNIRRDKRNIAVMRRKGWKVLRIWASELEGEKKEATLWRVLKFAKGR